MRLLALLFAAVLCTSACGGGKEAVVKDPVRVPAAETGYNYLPQFAKSSTGRVVWEHNPDQQASKWTAGGGNITWGDSSVGHEKLTVGTCSDGRRWILMRGYDDDGNGGPRWPIITVQQTVNGQTLVCEGNLTVHFPIDLPPDGTVLEVKQWFYIAGPERPGYWQGRFTFGQSAYNPCWKLGGPKERKVVWWEEAWWDAIQGWTDRGTSPDVPFQMGAPVEVPVTYHRNMAIARDTGFFWRETRTDGQPTMCLAEATLEGVPE